MKWFTLLLVAQLIASLQPAALPASASVQAERKEYFQGLPLCPPDAYPQEPDDCLPLGPSSQLTELAKLGLTLPAAPLPAAPVNSTLGVVGYQYLLLNTPATPVFSTLEDAAANRPRRTLPAGRKYLAYKQRIENAQGVFYQFQTTEWIRGESVSSRVGYSTISRGALFSAAPRADFGWTIEEVPTRTAPGVKGQLTGRKIPIYALVYAYDVRKADNYDWVMVGINEWIEDRLIGRVVYDPTPPAGVTGGRWVEINIGEQTVSVYQDNKLVFAALAATGVDKMSTRPGLFQATKKVPAEHMTGVFEADLSDYYYLESVPWTVYFDDARAMHGIYWRTNFGRPASHGCVNLTIADARWLYDWIKVNDYVFAWDGVKK